MNELDIILGTWQVLTPGIYFLLGLFFVVWVTFLCVSWKS